MDRSIILNAIMCLAAMPRLERVRLMKDATQCSLGRAVDAADALAVAWNEPKPAASPERIEVAAGGLYPL